MSSPSENVAEAGTGGGVVAALRAGVGPRRGAAAPADPAGGAGGSLDAGGVNVEDAVRDSEATSVCGIGGGRSTAGAPGGGSPEERTTASMVRVRPRASCRTATAPTASAIPTVTATNTGAAPRQRAAGGARAVPGSAASGTAAPGAAVAAGVLE